MTKEQLETMFLAEGAWEKSKNAEEIIGQLIEALAALNETVIKLTAVLKD